MSFENFPYSNFHELNLDWIIQKLKEAYSAENPPDFPVKSVNGMTGDVIIAIPSNFVQSVNGETGDVVLYRNPLTQFPATDEVRWNLFRICDGTEKGIEFDEDGAHRIEGIRRIKIYDEDNPPDYPVTSVNGQTGDVQVTAGVQSVNGKTGNVVTPFVNPNTDILTLDSNSPSVLWGISRNVAGGNVALYITTGGTNPQAFIRYIPDGGQAINLPLLTNADIPESAGVVSVNGKTGAVTLYGSDILTTENGKTIAQDISYLNTAFTTTVDKLYGTFKVFNLTDFTQDGLTFSNNTAIAVNPTTGIVNRTVGTFVPEIGKTYVFESGAGNSSESSCYLYVMGVDGSAIWYETGRTFTCSTNSMISIKLYCTTNVTVNVAFTPIISEYPVLNSKYLNNKIITLESEYNTQNQQISALQSSDTTQNQQISALQSSDTTQNQQISALQSSDSTQNQQIITLQSSDTTQNQQISALQTAIDNIQTWAGIKEVKLSEVITLPIRYPATGTDADIKANMTCVNAIISRPGVQRTNFTVEFFDGYLTVSGTMQGLTDITLYLTEV